MQRITTTDELTREIKRLEIKQASDKFLLKQQLHITYESLKPLNLIKKTISEMTESPTLKNGIVNTVIGMAAGYLSKKVTVGSSPGPVKSLLGNALQLIVRKFVTNKTKNMRDAARERSEARENAGQTVSMEDGQNDYNYD